MAEVKVVSRKPGAVSFNYEEIKAEVSAKAAEYKVAVYSAENIGEAKADRAKLNKLKTMLNDERLKREREFMKPFEEFKSQVADLIRIIDEPIKAIDSQVKAFEDAEKEEKKKECVALFEELNTYGWLSYSQVEDRKWYNKTTALSTVSADIMNRLSQIGSEIGIILDFGSGSFEAFEYYKKTLDLQASIAEGKRAFEVYTKKETMAREAVADVDDSEETTEWVSFRALLTPRMAKALVGFCKLNGIKIEKGE